MLNTLNVTREIIEANEKKIETLCKCVLEGGPGDIVFDDLSISEQTEFKQAVINNCQTLATAIRENNYKEAAFALIRTLYSVRNARVHAEVSQPEKRGLGGDSGSTVTSRGPGEKREVSTVAEILLSMGKILVSAKTNMTMGDIEILVSSRVRQIAFEIYKKVKLRERFEINLPPYRA